MNRLPIRFRLTLIATALSALAVSAVAGSALYQTSRLVHAELDTHLEEEAEEVLFGLRNGLSVSTFAGDASAFSALRIGLFDETGRVIEASDRKAPIAPGDERPGTPYTVLDSESGERYRTLVLPVPSEDSHDVMVIGMPLASVERELAEGRNRTLLLALATIVVIGLGSYLLTGLALGPIERLRRNAEQLSSRSPGGRLPLPVPRDEVRRLAETLNAGLEVTELAMEAQRNFVAAASHELRTPIARLRADIDLARRPARTFEELVTALGDIDDHAMHLTAISDNLLAALAPQATTASRSRVITVGEALGWLQDRSPKHAELSFAVPVEAESATLFTDPTGLVGALSNLIENACRHGAPPVEFSVVLTTDWASFAVRDHGSGIPVEQREEVLIPFHRAVAATSGSGLGLSVVHLFAISQGGELVIGDSDPGCLMVLRLPRAPADVVEL